MNQMNNEFREQYALAETVFVSKGENRLTVEKILETTESSMPAMPRRCLHVDSPK